VGGVDGILARPQLLVDTGASYPILPAEVINGLGYDLQAAQNKVRLTGVNGISIVPIVQVSWFNCLGQVIKNFPVLVHTIPTGIYADGLLGMDFLIQCKAVISVADAQIRLQS
jgi:aspartyl protease family protein